MRIAWDLDGVLRDLNGYLHLKYGIPKPKDWFWKYENKDIYEWIKQDNYAALIYAPSTPYERIAKMNFDELEIWTCQPEEWKQHTKLWLDVHFENYEVFYLTNEEKRKKLDEEENVILIEDNPLFTHWNRILLIDQPYNRHIENVVRIHSAEEINDWITKNLIVDMV